MYKFILLTLVSFNFIVIKAQTKIIAHRGFSAIAPENTLIAFQKAIEIGADYFELDVRMTKDDSLVVIHDETVDRTSSNQMSGEISEMKYMEIAKVKAGYSERFGNEYANEKVPTLREALKTAKGKIKVAIELKVYGAENEVIKLVNDLGVKDEVIIFSFYYPVLAKIRKLDKDISTLYLLSSVDSSTIDYANVIEANAIGLHSGAGIDAALLEEAHKSGMEVWVWTVNDEGEMKKFINLGVDGLITDSPDRAIEIIKNQK